MSNKPTPGTLPSIAELFAEAFEMASQLERDDC
jgi:hypothetical protein